MKYLYKYPQAEFPYERLVAENRQRGVDEPEFELIDTGVFAENRYFDVFVEYAKARPDDILIEITIANRGPEQARPELLPTIWFRNTWAWGRRPPPAPAQGRESVTAELCIELHDSYYGQRYLHCQPDGQLLFTENETNMQRLFGAPNSSPYVKDAFHEYVVHGRREGQSRGSWNKGGCALPSAHWRWPERLCTFPPDGYNMEQAEDPLGAGFHRPYCCGKRKQRSFMPR